MAFTPNSTATPRLAQPPRPEAASHIVKYHALPESNVNREPREECFNSFGDAEEFSLNLVKNGEALPRDIVIYENTNAGIVVTCQQSPRPPSR